MWPFDLHLLTCSVNSVFNPLPLSPPHHDTSHRLSTFMEMVQLFNINDYCFHLLKKGLRTQLVYSLDKIQYYLRHLLG